MNDDSSGEGVIVAAEADEEVDEVYPSEAINDVTPVSLATICPFLQRRMRRQ